MSRDHASRDDLPQAPGEDRVAELLGRAGHRPDVPEEAVEELWRVSQAAWQEQVQVRARRRRWQAWSGLAAAAVLVLAVALPRWWRAEPAESVAFCTFSEGEVSADGPDAASRFAAGDALVAGTWVETLSGSTPGRVALRLASGPLLRLDVGTRLRFDSGVRGTLESGAIYVESGAGSPQLEIHTAWGTVRNLGTRFEVRIQPAVAGGEALRVRVRDGEVAVEHEGGRDRAKAGEELTVQPDGSVAHATTRLYGKDWSWIGAAAPTFDIEDRQLSEFLDWIVTENGWSLVSDPRFLDASVLATRLRGEIEGLGPEEALETILTGYGLHHRLVDGFLYIEPETLRID